MRMLRSFIEKVKKGIYRDFILSLAASAVTTVMAQLVTYPLLSRLLSPEEYGKILTIMGVANVITLAFGNSLNNVRLVMNTDYDDANVQGDFLPILSFLTIVGAVIFSIYLYLFGQMSIIIISSLIIFAVFGILQSYGSVAFRIKINYLKNFFLSLIIALGNILGIIVLYITKSITMWGITFALGQVLGVVYIAFSSSIFRESFNITQLFKKTVKKESVLLFTTLCANILVYLDRLLLYPLLGGDAVSTYTVASFFGKSLAILMTPICGVLLSYYSQKYYKMGLKRFWRINGITLLMAFAFTIFSLFVSEWITGLLYPDIIEQAKSFLFIANLAAVINVVGNMAQPVVLKFATTKWIAINQVSYMTVYLGLGIVLSKTGGLMGFSYAALLASIVRLIIFYSVGHVTFSGKAVK